mgnify:CR=1 FL=1
MAAIYEIVNEDFELKAIPAGAAKGVPEKFKFIPPTLNTATKLKINRKKVLVEKIEWSVPKGSCLMTGCIHLGSISITPIKATTAQKCKADQKPVLLKNDEGICKGKFKDPNNNEVLCMCKIVIKNAGQTKVKGE